MKLVQSGGHLLDIRVWLSFRYLEILLFGANVILKQRVWVIALYFWLFEDVRPAHFNQHDLNFRFVHFKVIYCWGKSPIGVIRFIPEPDANILWMSWWFHRQLWCLQKEKFSYTPRKKKKTTLHSLLVVPDLQDVQLLGARHIVPEALLSSYFVFYEMYLSQACQVSYNVA